MFATVMCLVLPMCIFISYNYVLMTLGMFMFVEVMSSLISVMSPLLVCALCLCVWWCSGVFFCVLAFCVSFVSCIVMMSGWVLCTKFLDFVSDTVYVDLKYDDVFVLWLIVVCEWLGGDLSAMDCCVVCAWCCYDLWVCVYGASPVRFLLSLFYLCTIQMNPVCVVCVVTSD